MRSQQPAQLVPRQPLVVDNQCPHGVSKGSRSVATVNPQSSPSVSDARVIGWAGFKGGLRGYFYWHGVHWHHNSQRKVGSRDQDVWGNPVTFDERDASGEGSAPTIDSPKA